MKNDDASSLWRDTNYDSDYRELYPKTSEGKRLDLKPGSELHQKLTAAIREYGLTMWDYGRPVREKTKEIRNNLDCVVPKRTREQTIAQRENPEKPFDVMVPLARACGEHFTSFAMSEFTSPYGNYELEGEGPDGMYSAAINEIVLNAQSIWFGHNQHYINFFRSCCISPVAAMVPVWSKHKAKNTVEVEVGETLREMIEDILPDAVQGEVLRLLDEQTLHEGNRLESIDSTLLLIHPDSKMGDFESQQRATCDGYVVKGNAFDIMSRETDPEEHLMNGKYLSDLCEKGKGKTPWLGNELFADESGRSDNYNLSPVDLNQSLASDFFTGVRLWWWLRPKKWGLGKSDRPELWVMTLAADEVIIECRPVTSWSGRKEIVRASVTNDGHYAYPTSMLAMIHGIQQYLQWKVRAQVSAETKSLNGVLFTHQNVFDNYDELINRKELSGVIWTRPPKFGEPYNLSANFYQPNISTPDPNWAGTIALFMGLYNQIFGISQITQGDMSGMPERPTAFGIGTVNDNAADRMGLYMEALRWQWFQPLVFQLGMNTLQYLEKKYFYNIVGARLEEELRYEFGPDVTALPISPSDVRLNWRVSAQSHRHKSSMLQAYQMLVERLASVPEIAMQMVPDPPRLLNYFMREIGAPNIFAFTKKYGDRLNVQVLPDEQIMSMRDRGAAVPIGQLSERAG